MSTLQVIEEESFQYRGPVTQCFGGGGGSSSGQSDWPQYMKAFHDSLLSNNEADLPISLSMVDAMEAAFGSPWGAKTAYDPDADITAMEASMTNLETLVNLLSAGTGLDALVANVLSEARIDDAVDEFSLDLGDRLTVEVLPRFEAGMRDINAVVSSAFVIGRSNIEGVQTRQVAKYSADLHAKAFGDDALALIALKLGSQKSLSHMDVETKRIKIVAKGEETGVNHELIQLDATWDLSVFQHGSNLLASIGSGLIGPDKGPTRTGSMIGGGMSGAAAGAYIGAEYGSAGGWWGAGIGAVVGAVGGYLSYEYG